MASMTRVTNVGTQEVSIQIQPPGSDFYVHQKQVRLMPGKGVTIPTNHLLMAQIENLKTRRQISTQIVA
jgi:hypothetical protein